MAARKSALLIEVPPTQADNPTETTANAGLSLVEGRADRVDPFALAMDQALGLEATQPFTTASRWNSHAIEFAWSLAPVVCDLFSLAVKACVELQLNWLTWIPGWHLGTGADGSGALESEEPRRLAESMDVAIGAQPAQPGPALLPYAAAVNASMAVAAADSTAEEQAEPPAKVLAAAG